MIIKPWMKILAAVILAGMLIAAFNHWKNGIYQDGFDARDKIAKIEEARIKSEAQEKLIVAQHEAAFRERNLRDLLNIEQKTRLQESKKHETIARYQSDARAGAFQLRIPTTTDKVSGNTGNQSPGATSGPIGTQVGILLPETTADILGIAGEIGRDMRQINGLIDAYEALRKDCK
jgi:hypothetical protein